MAQFLISPGDCFGKAVGETSNSNAVLIIFHRETGRVLVTLEKRRNGERKIGLPGGKIDPNESAWNAALRELKEETSGIIDIQKMGYRFVNMFYQRKTYFFVISVTGPTPKGRINNKEIEAIEWMKWSDFKKGLRRDNDGELVRVGWPGTQGKSMYKMRESMVNVIGNISLTCE